MRRTLPSISWAALLATISASGIRAAPGGIRGGLWLEETFDLETEGAFGDRTELDLAFARGVMGEGLPFIASPAFALFPRYAAPVLSAGEARSGRWSMRFFIRGEPMRAEFDPRSRRAAVPGASCVLLAWVAARGAEPATVEIGIEWLRKRGDREVEDDIDLVTLGIQRSGEITLRGTLDWQRIRCDAQAPDGATSFIPFVEVRPSDPAARGGAIAVDDISFRWVPALTLRSSPASRFLIQGEPIRWKVSSSPLPPEILRALARRAGGRGEDAGVPEALRRTWREEAGERDVNRRTVTLRLLAADGTEKDRLAIAGSIVPEDRLEWEGAFPKQAPEAGYYTVVAELRTKRGGEEPEVELSAGVAWFPGGGDYAGGGGLILACGWPVDWPIPADAARMLPGPVLADLPESGGTPPAWALAPVARLAVRMPAAALGDPRLSAIAGRSQVAIIHGTKPADADLAPLARVPIILHESDANTLVPIRGARAARILDRSFADPGGAGRLARAIAECAAAGIDVAILRNPEALIERSAGGVGPRPTFLAWSAIGGALAGGVAGAWSLDPRGSFLRIPRRGGETIIAWANGDPFRLRYASPNSPRITDAIGRVRELSPSDGAVEVEVGPEPIVLDGMSGAREATLGTIRVAAPIEPHGRWQPIAFEVENRGDKAIALRANARCPVAEIRLDRREVSLRPGERGRFEGRIRLSPEAENPVPVTLDVETSGDGGRLRILAPVALAAPPFEIEGPDWAGEGPSPSGTVRIRNLAAERVRAHIHISAGGSTALRSAGRPLAPGETCALTFRVPERREDGSGRLRIGVIREGDAAFATKTVPVPDGPADAPAR